MFLLFSNPLNKVGSK